jgi:hypothetical protein
MVKNSTLEGTEIIPATKYETLEMIMETGNIEPTKTAP